MDPQNDNNSNEKGFIIKSTLTFSLTNIILFAIGLCSLWVSGTFISSYDMGIISILTIFYSMAELMTLSLNVGVQRYLSFHLGENDKEKAQSIINLAFLFLIFYLIGSNTIIPIVMILVLNILSISVDFFIILVILSAVNFYQLFTYFNSLLSTYKQYNKVAIISFISSITGILISLFFIIQGFSIIGFIIRYVISNLVGFVLFVSIMHKLKLSFYIKSKKFYELKKIFNFSFPHFINVFFINMILYFFVKTMIASFLGLNTLGYYEFSYNIFNIFNTIMLGFNNIILIHLTHEYGERGIDGIKANLSWITRVISFIVFPLLYFILIFSYPFLFFIIPKYLPSVMFLNWLVISGVIPLIYYAFTGVLFALGKNWQILISNTISYMGLTILYVFLPYLGVIGVIIGDYTLRISYTIIILLFCTKYVEIREHVIIPIKFFVKTLPIAIIGTIFSLIFPQIYFIPFNILIFLGLFIVIVRYGKLISVWEIDKGFSFLPEKLLKIIKKIFIKEI
ncbi:MAG: lipopolysaccharide biosynthesis protein [Candidatus Lokiarchaeota archaeon]|nr:lipopolysaccharide biosynthesis protein [Candidatus Lokiarchaeota archaeon]